MQYTADDIIRFVEENDVKFIRLAFCDVFGILKNISIMPSELRRAFDKGMPIDTSAIAGFCDAFRADLLLVPDPSTLSLLPWRPSHGRVVRMLCDIMMPDGKTRFVMDARRLLLKTVEKLEKAKISCSIGSECEFYLFKTDDRENPTKEPIDLAGYMDIAPEDKGENVRREICLTLEEMGIRPESSRHEEGPGQNEIDFHQCDPLASADDLITFKSVVRTIASRNGLFATFEPKPLPEYSGNGLHINVSPSAQGMDDDKCVDSFMAGLLNRIREITVFLNPTAQSYKRFGSFKAPKYISWSPENRSQLIRRPSGDSPRIELRSPDPMANPYIAYALILSAGLEGIEKGLVPPESHSIDLAAASDGTLSKLLRLPENYEEAAAIAADSDFVKSVLPAGIIDAYTRREVR